MARVLPHPIVVLAAPAGHGKTCLASQVAAATGGPTAWLLADEMDRDRATVVGQLFAALESAWIDLTGSAPSTLDDDSAVPLLGAALETLAGPGCIVLDDVHLLPTEVLDAVARTAVAALPPTCRLVVCTRGGVPDALVGAEATGAALVLGPGDLTFDPDECARVSGSPGPEVHDRTGGWPLAVALWSTSATTVVTPDHADRLAEVALAELGPLTRVVLVVLARLPRYPARLLTRLSGGAPDLESFGRRNPALLSYDDGWWAPREWLRDALGEDPVDPSTLRAVVAGLRDLDEDELAAQLLLAEERYEEAVPLVEQLAGERMRAGRAAAAKSLVAAVPSPVRTFALDVLAASVAQALSLADPVADAACSELAILGLVRRAEAGAPGELLQARALLAGHYRMEADLRVLAVCEDALGDALTASSPAEVVRSRWSVDDIPAAAELLRLYGQALLFAQQPEEVRRGRRLVAAALELMEAAKQPTTSRRGWSTYVEVLLFLRPSTEAVRELRMTAHLVADADHYEGPLRLAELATVEYFAGDPAARRTIEMAREAAARTGNGIALTPVASIEVGLDVADSGFDAEHGRRFDEITAQLAANARLAPFTALIAAEFGIVLAQQARAEDARRYLDLANRSLGSTIFARVNRFRCRRLDGLVQLAEGRVDEARRTLEALRGDAAAEGRTALVELVTADLAGLDPTSSGTGAARYHERRREAPPVEVHVLAPELHVRVDDERQPAPRGFPAKLLALLTAARGSMTVDAAIEGLWPGADPDVGRNRLHGVLLRLRRGLGLGADGPIRCTEGIVVLEPSTQLVVDSWEFERLAAGARREPDLRRVAAAAYTGDVLSVQFAYDDAVSDYRRSLRRTFLDLATSLLTEPPSDLDAHELASLARRASQAAPSDEQVCLAAVGTLARTGHTAEARELIDLTASALHDVGLDDEAFRRAVSQLVSP
jgi:DNA-binding SARP family transcriptional activator